MFNQRLTRNEVCQILRVSLSTLENRIKSGEIKITRDGARVFITQDELERYMKQCNDE